MKISLNWLQDFVTLIERDPQKIARRVTEGVAEVDDLEVQGAYLDGTCVGRIAELKRHPGADRLSLCKVETDRGVKQVVCGATNLRLGMRVALAHVGTRVRGRDGETVTLTKAKIRGEESEGMICAAEELELAERFPPRPEEGERPIVDLGDGAEGVGTGLREYLGLDDIVLHIDNHAITHRPDLFSQYGFAREFVALGLATWKKRAAKKIAFGSAPPPFKMIVDDPKAVPYYSACLVEIDGIGETPEWMKRRLAATGWRSINLPIDITNYVLMETGMPHHGFDAGDFRGDVHIRRAKKGEEIVTLDNEKRALPEGAIIMSDDDGIFDLFGIMGGLRSSTKATTRKIFLQAGIPDPVSIRKTVIQMGHRTDAATVYEKGVPREASLRGLTRAVELFLELVPGARVASKIVSWGEIEKPPALALDLSVVSRKLGTEVSAGQAEKILTDLEFDVKAGKKTGAALTVTPPLHRVGDIRGIHDLTEEIGRVIGYNDIEARMPEASIAPPPRDPRLHRLRGALQEERFFELLPVSLIGASVLERSLMDPSAAVRLQNPIGEETALLQTSTFPSLLEHAQRNILHADEHLRTFHWGHVFSGKEPEREEMSLLLADMHGGTQDLGHDPFLLLKRHLSAAARSIGFVLDVAPAGSAPPYAHPGRFGDILLRPLDEDADAPSAPSEKIGLLFEVHPDVRAAFDLPRRAAAAIIDLSRLLSPPARVQIARSVPLFPAVTYDVTLTLSQKEQSGDLLRRLREGSELLESVRVTNVYSGKEASTDQYQLTLRCTYRAPDRTLTEDEAKKEHETLLRGIEN